MVTSPSRHLLPSWQFKVRRSFIVHKTFQELHSKTAFPKMANGISSDFFKMNWLEIGSQRSKVRVTLTSQNMFVAITQFYAQMSNKWSEVKWSVMSKLVLPVVILHHDSPRPWGGHSSYQGKLFGFSELSSVSDERNQKIFSFKKPESC